MAPERSLEITLTSLLLRLAGLLGSLLKRVTCPFFGSYRLNPFSLVPTHSIPSLSSQIPLILSLPRLVGLLGSRLKGVNRLLFRSNLFNPLLVPTQSMPSVSS